MPIQSSSRWSARPSPHRATCLVAVPHVVRSARRRSARRPLRVKKEHDLEHAPRRRQFRSRRMPEYGRSLARRRTADVLIFFPVAHEAHAFPSTPIKVAVALAARRLQRTSAADRSDEPLHQRLQRTRVRRASMTTTCRRRTDTSTTRRTASTRSSGGEPVHTASRTGTSTSPGTSRRLPNSNTSVSCDSTLPEQPREASDARPSSMT